MFLWGVVLAWWLLTGTAATIFGGTAGLLLYLFGIWGYLLATNFRFVSQEFAGLIFVIGGSVGLLSELLSKRLAEKYPIKNQVTSLLIGSSAIAVLIGMLIGPFVSLISQGTFFGFPFFALIKKHTFRQWVASYSLSLIRLFFVLIVNLILLHQFIMEFYN